MMVGDTGSSVTVDSGIVYQVVEVVVVVVVVRGLVVDVVVVVVVVAGVVVVVCGTVVGCGVVVAGWVCGTHMEEGVNHGKTLSLAHHGRGVVLRGWPPCLLYTSPSPRDQLSSRMPSSA